jgi:hypothetical protein
MRTAILFLLGTVSLPLARRNHHRLVGLRHSHTWGHLEAMVKSSPAKLVAIAETEAELVTEAKKLTAPDVRYYADYKKMLDEVKPTMVWAFVENNRHHEVVEACGARKIHVIFEKPLAATAQQAFLIRDLARKHGIQVLTNFGPAFSQLITPSRRSSILANWASRGGCATTGLAGSSPVRPTGSSTIVIDPAKNGAAR